MFSYRKAVVKLERMQKIFTRILPGLKSLSYKERLDQLGHFSLEDGIGKMDDHFFSPKIGVPKTRGHMFKVRGEKISET